MALLGAFYSNQVGSGFRYYVSWSATQNVNNNTSYVTAKVYASMPTSRYTYFNGTVKLTIDGTLYNLTDYNKYCTENTTTLLFTQSKTVYHSSAGYKTLAISMWADDGTLPNENYIDYSGSGSWDLNRILRYATITSFYTANITATGFSYVVTANVAIDYAQHSINGGAWVDGGNQTITGLTPNTQYSLKVRVRRTDSQLWTESSTIYQTTALNTPLITSFTLAEATMSSFNVYWSANASIGLVEYSLNGGAWQTAQSGIAQTDSLFVLSWLNPNTQYSLKIKVRRSDDGTTWSDESETKYYSTLDYARVTGADSINDAGSPYMTFTNTSGAVIDAYIEYGFVNGVATASVQRTNIQNTGSYSFTLTSGEKSAIYSKMTTSNSQTIRYTLVTVVGGVNTYWSYLDRTFSLVNANPTFTTFTYEDINETTTALTGSNQIIVKGYSSLRGIVTTANKMVAIKGATAKEYQLAVTGSTPVKANYSADATVNLDIGVVSNNVFITNAIDSRNNATPVTVNASTYKEYFNVAKGVVADNTIERTGSVSKETTLKLKGTFWNASFGSVTNDFVNAKYRYKDTDDADYSAYTNITLTKNGNEFSYNHTIAGDDGANGFLIENSYNVQVLISDKLSSVTYDFILGTGTPNISVHKDGIALKGLYDETLGGALQVNGSLQIPSIADVSLSSTDNPIQIGLTSGINVVMDSNEIIARNNGGTSPLYLNNDGGGVYQNNILIEQYKTGPTIADLNDALTDGCYTLSGGSNGPSGVTYGTVWVVNAGSLTKAATTGYCNQTLYDAQTNNIWYRRKIDNNAWSSWIKIYPQTSLMQRVTGLNLTAGGTESHSNTNIANASQIVVYYSVSSSGYRRSMTISNGETEWSHDVDTTSGYAVYFRVNWTGSPSLVLSQYSTVNGNCKIVGYDLIY